MLQTFWEVNRQIIRKAIDGLSGVAIGYLGTQGEWGIALVPIVIIAGNGLWFYLDNRNKVTVAGLEAAGEGNTAIAVEDAVIDAKKKGI